MTNTKTKKKKNLLLTFLIIVFGAVFVYGGIAFGGIYYYLKAHPQPVYDASKQTKDLMSDDDVTEQKNSAIKDNGIFANVLTPPVRTNFLIVGVDKKESLTDSIMVGSYVSTTNEINIMSIPRDTFVEYDSADKKKFSDVGRSVPSSSKINAVNAYGGEKYGIIFLQDELEQMLGIKIDYYVKVNLDAFKDIVDEVGGIDFEVPEGGLYYSDPTQNLNINLKGGMQHLNGSQAEGLVRFRKGYARQDLHRVEIQQEFVKEFVKQVMAKDTIKNNLPTLITNYLKNVKTNFTVEDLPKYIKCMSNFNTDNMNSATLPGYPQMIGNGSYYIYNPSETKELVDKFFYGSTSEEATTEETTDEASSETTTAVK